MNKSKKSNHKKTRKVVKKKMNSEMSKNDKIYLLACTVVIIVFLCILAFNLGKYLALVA